MEQVTGIGGFFFRASDPALPAGWYETHLGISKTPKTYEEQQVAPLPILNGEF